MIAHTIPSRFPGFIAALRAAGLLATCLVMPLTALAQEPSVTTPPVGASVSLAGLDLTTTRGIDAARNRLHEAARRSCSQTIDDRDPEVSADFLSCIDSTLITELKQINRSTRTAILAVGSAWPTAIEIGTTSHQRETAQSTSVMVVSIADLDVLSPQDVLLARKRIHDTARRICGQLSKSQDPASIYAKCVNDAIAAALRQFNKTALAAN
jgi:UrcA family protein